MVSEIIKQIKCYAYISKCLFSAFQNISDCVLLFAHTSLLITMNNLEYNVTLTFDSIVISPFFEKA